MVEREVHSSNFASQFVFSRNVDQILQALESTPKWGLKAPRGGVKVITLVTMATSGPRGVILMYTC